MVKTMVNKTDKKPLNTPVKKQDSNTNAGANLSNMYWLKAELPVKKSNIFSRLSYFFHKKKTQPTPTPFKPKKNQFHRPNALKCGALHRLQVLITDTLIHAPVAAAIIYGIPVVKEWLPLWIGGAFNLPNAQRITSILHNQTTTYQSLVSMSYPASVSNYLSALTASTIANAKTGMLEATTKTVAATAGIILSILGFLALVWLFFSFIRFYKNRMRQHRLTSDIVTALKPEFDDIRHRLDRLERLTHTQNRPNK